MFRVIPVCSPPFGLSKIYSSGGIMDILKIVQQLGSGMLVSGEIFFLTLIFSLPLGLAVAFGRMSRFKIVSTITKFYISIMRGTPLMLQLMVVYFGPYFLLGARIDNTYRFTAVIVGFVLNYAAYFSEIYRSGIESIPAGQREAAQVLGFSKAQTFVKIILPQVIKRVLPPVTNEIITLVKDTSLAFVIGTVEMFTMAKNIVAAQSTLIPFVIAGLFYYIFNLLVAFIMERVEKKLSYYN